MRSRADGALELHGEIARALVGGLGALLGRDGEVRALAVAVDVEACERTGEMALLHRSVPRLASVDAGTNCTLSVALPK